MYSLIAGALIAAASAYLGLGIKRIFSERYLFVSGMRDFADYMKREVAHLKTPLSELIEVYASQNSGAAVNALKKYSEGLRYGYGRADEVLKLIKKAYLTGADNLVVADFLYGLGKGDMEAEITNLNRFYDIFAKKTEIYGKDLKQKGTMYFKLLVLMGLAVLVILV